MLSVTTETFDVSKEKSMHKSLLRTTLAFCVAFLFLAAHLNPTHAQVSVGPQDVTGAVGDTVTVAIEAGDLSESNITSYQFTAAYDSSVVEVLDVLNENTLSSDGLLQSNTETPGETRVAFASDTVLGGAGTLLEFQVVLQSAGTTTISLDGARFFDQDGQEVQVDVTEGTVESSVALTLPDRQILRTTDSLVIPVQVGNLTGANASSYQFTLSFNPDVIDITEVLTEGTLSEGGNVEFNQTGPGEVKLAFASDMTLEGPGTLLRLQAITGNVGDSPLTVGDSFRLFSQDGTSIPTMVEAGSVAVTEVARAQFIHNAADPAASAVDVYFGSQLVLDDFEFRTATPFIDVPADVEINVGVAPGSSTSASDTLASFPLTLAPDQSHTIVANGVLDPASFAENPNGEDIGFRFLVDANAQEEAVNADSVDVRAVHGATDAPTVDIGVNGTTLFDDVVYGDISGYITAPPAALRLVVTPGDSDAVVAAFQADLSGLAGQAATVLASGFLDPTANQDGPAFGLIAVLPDGTVVSFPANQPPTFTTVPTDQTVQPGSSIEAQFDAEDPDGDPVGFSLTDAPENASIDSTSGLFSFTPTPAQAGNSFTIGVQASDGVATADTSFAVTVGEIDRGPIAVDINLAFGDATQQRNYRLAGLPGQVDLPIESTLSGESGEFNDWRVFWDNGASTTQDGLVEFDGSSQFNFRPGRGFWVLSKNNWVVQQEFQPVPLDDAANASVSLHDGWNIVSNPLGKDIAWSAVQSANDVSQPLWSFTGSFNQTSSFASAQSGQAFYFLNEAGLDQLQVPFFDTAPSSVAKSEENARIVQLTAMVDNKPASSVWVGTRPDAKEGRDAFDHFSPPGYFTDATLSVANDQITSQYSLASDVRPANAEGHTYDLVLEAESGTSITLKAKGLSDLSPEQEVRLYDSSTGQTFDLRTSPVAQVTPTSEQAEFALLVGTSSYIDQKQSELVPQKLQLRQNYPNPFRGQTTVEYTLPEQTEVKVEVYDILGRQIRTLLDGKTQRAGVHTLQWNAQNDMGRSVASGVYLTRLQAGDQTRTIKMVVIK